MNKKFSTLMTAGFLVGGALFCNVNARTVTAGALDKDGLDGTGADKEVTLGVGTYSTTGGYFIIDEPNTILTGVEGTVITGRLVIAAEGVTVKGVKFVNTPVHADANGYWTKNTITAFADKLTVKGNEFTEGTPTGDSENMVVCNNLVIYPQTGTAVAYDVTENEFTANLVASKNGGYTSYAVIIGQGSTMDATKTADPLKDSDLKGYKSTTTGKITDKTFDVKAIAANNTFTKCFADYLCQLTETVVKAESKTTVQFTQVTLDSELGNELAVIDALASATADSKVVLNGDAKEILDVLADAAKIIATAEGLSDTDKTTLIAGVKDINAAVECTDSYLLFGEATVPTTTKPVQPVYQDNTGVITSGAPEKIVNQKLVEEVTTGSYYLLSDGTGNKFVSVDGNGALTTTSDASASAALWKVDVTKPAGIVQYTFTNKLTEKVLTITDNGTDYKVFTTLGGSPYKNGFILTSGDKFIGSTIGVPAIKSAQADAVYFGLYEAGLISYSADYLLNKLGAGFDMTIDTEKDADATIKGNPFAGILKPVKGVKADGDDFVANEFASIAAAKAASSYYLQNAEGKFIALDLNKDNVWSATTANLNGKNGRGFKLVTLTAKEVNDAKAGEYLFNFSVQHLASVDDATSIVITAMNTNGTAFGRLYIATVDGVNYLTTSPLYSLDTDEVWPYTIFGGSNLTDLKTLVKKSFWTIVNANVVNEDNNGKAYAIPAGAKENPGIVPTTGGAYMDTTNVLLTSPEAQWAPTVVDGKLVLTNRENPDVKIIGWSLYNVDAAKGIYTVAGTKDTINISLVDRSKLDGFASYGENYLKNTEFNMAIETLLGNAYMSENHAGKHQIGLVDNVAGAATWKLEKEFAGRPDSKTATDSVYVISKIGYFADNKWKTVDDTLAILPYVIKNVANGEYITYSKDANIKGYVCDDSKAKAAALRFALKMKPDNTFNLVEITGTKTGFNGALADNKMFGGVSAKEGLVNRIGKYNQTENDRVVILPLDAPEYRKLAMGDTIKVYRSESTDEAQVLFEQGEFLSIQNAVQFPKINPAMYVDTAFVDRADNNRWEYLLAVDKVRHFDANSECDIPGHPSHKADTTYGRFLVNLVDSAFAYGKTHLHDNKFINDKDSEPFAKLGFVSGYHTHDTLYVARPNGKFDALSLTRVDNPYSVAKFAFRIVDKDSKDFIIETGYKAYNTTKLKYSEEPGFLKWLNGVVVVVPTKEDADIFNLNADESRIPTDNEGIETTEVSVIAGNGSVTINNAAGKTIAISNILGQAIANTVLSSDNETIAVPAGIVVVAVEGEAAVKAIVK